MDLRTFNLGCYYLRLVYDGPYSSSITSDPLDNICASDPTIPSLEKCCHKPCLSMKFDKILTIVFRC